MCGWWDALGCVGKGKVVKRFTQTHSDTHREGEQRKGAGYSGRVQQGRVVEEKKGK